MSVAGAAVVRNGSVSWSVAYLDRLLVVLGWHLLGQELALRLSVPHLLLLTWKSLLLQEVDVLVEHLLFVCVRVLELICRLRVDLARLQLLEICGLSSQLRELVIILDNERTLAPSVRVLPALEAGLGLLEDHPLPCGPHVLLMSRFGASGSQLFLTYGGLLVLALGPIDRRMRWLSPQRVGYARLVLGVHALVDHAAWRVLCGIRTRSQRPLQPNTLRMHNDSVLTHSLGYLLALLINIGLSMMDRLGSDLNLARTLVVQAFLLEDLSDGEVGRLEIQSVVDGLSTLGA